MDKSFNNISNSKIYVNSSTFEVQSQLSTTLGKETIIGREKELQEIDERLNNSNSLLLINGIGGIGKSTIASYYLHSQKEKLDYYGFFESLESFTVELKPRLKLNSSNEDELFMEALSTLSALEGNKLLVFDDVKNIEANQDKIEKILALKESGYKILLTSREEIEEVEQYYLDVLTLDDAKELFNSIYLVEDEAVLEEILGYLDCHAFFVEMTAKTLKSKKTLTPEIIKEKFTNGEFSTIKRKRKESFNDYLNELFSFDELDDEDRLLLKKLSVLPSISIKLKLLNNFLSIKEEEQEDFEDLLNFLSTKGWIIRDRTHYKLHQIIKDYIWKNHKPMLSEIDSIVLFFAKLIANAEDIRTANLLKGYIVYFESIDTTLNRVEIYNEKITEFWDNLGMLYKHNGAYDKALPYYVKVMKIRKKVLGEEHPDTAISYGNLAGLYRSKGEYDKAEPLYKKALEIYKKVLGEEHPSTATSYNNLAELYSSKGEYDKAEPLYKKALEIGEKVLGEEHPNTAISYNNLAELYRSKGEYDKAELLYEKALEIREKVLGKEHPHTATNYNNLAELYMAKGEYEKAEPLYEKALEIWKKVLGEEHPDTAISYSNLGVFYYKQGSIEEGYELMRRAVEIRSEVLPANHPNLIASKKCLEIMKKSL